MKLFAGFVLVAGLVVPSAMASRIHRAPTGGHSHSSPHSPTIKPHKTHGQQGIDAQRATAIQTALIREHYMAGEPTGRWDETTQSAMLKFQADQGWQTRLTPDSRALIKLGLGPDHSGAINGSAGTSFNVLASPVAAPVEKTQGFVAASGVSH